MFVKMEVFKKYYYVNIFVAGFIQLLSFVTSCCINQVFQSQGLREVRIKFIFYFTMG